MSRAAEALFGRADRAGLEAGGDGVALGGKDEGPPGPRAAGGDGFYAAYFRDLHRNELDVFRYG